MADTYDFVKRAWQNVVTDGASKREVEAAMQEASAYMKPTFDNDDNYRAGTRTSDTVFTPTVSPTWTINAQAGKYLVAIVDGTPAAFTISLIASNIATAATIGTAWGDAVLLSSADAIMIYDTLDDVFDDCAWIQI